MSRIAKVAIGTFVSLCLVGCIQVDTIVKVKPDGSGTIEQTVLMSKEAIKQMEAFAQMGQKQEEGKKAKGFDIFDQEQIEKDASTMGEGVTYVSGKKISTEDGEGYRVVYSFTDINNVKVNQNPGSKVPSSGSSGGMKKQEKKEFLTFRFTKGRPATLVVRMPEAQVAKKRETKAEKAQVAQKPEDEQMAAQQMQMMSQMFKGMRVTVAVEVEGSIVETNATHREGSKITLMEMDFGSLLENQDKFKKFAQCNPETLEDAKEVMKDLPGIKVELEKEVTIKFR